MTYPRIWKNELKNGGYRVTATPNEEACLKRISEKAYSGLPVISAHGHGKTSKMGWWDLKPARTTASQGPYT
ncbi:hypothetical protein MK139_11330 [bacterium]|nr:hypothetical protein [bacterium]